MDKSPLRKLAPELRNRIYEAVFVSGEPLTITHEDTIFGRCPPTAIQPAITQVCKQLRHESLRLFYNTSTFTILLQDPGDDRFHKQVSNACRWLSDVQSECHESVSLLRLHMDINSFNVRYALENAKAELQVVSESLQQRGYQQPKLRTTVDSCRDPRIRGDEQYSLVKECFQDLGLDAEVKIWSW